MSKSKSEYVSEYVEKKIKALKKQRESAVRAALAKLRRGIGKPPWSIPELWGLVFSDISIEIDGKSKEFTAAEKAIYAAMTLYALHQQGKDVKQFPMSEKGASFGAVIRRLAIARDGEQWDEGPVRRRFIQAATSDGVEEFAVHLRGLVQLLRAEGIPLDYPKLAEDLYWFHFPASRDRASRSWGLEFYRKNDNIINNEEAK
jgi:CRISPR system Cascade subunit CasB